MPDLFTNPQQAEQLRQQLLRFAQLQLRDADLAEDVVQDTLAAALNNAPQFAHRASAQTWVFGILKNKLLGALRQRRQQRGHFEPLPDDAAALPFDERGRWSPGERPEPWANPQQVMEHQQFWTVFEHCINALPDAQAQVFAMRELLDLDSQAVMQELDISQSHLYVLLHRARLGLRACLQRCWFDHGAKENDSD